jgi:hypothetical protein
MKMPLHKEEKELQTNQNQKVKGKGNPRKDHKGPERE